MYVCMYVCAAVAFFPISGFVVWGLELLHFFSPNFVFCTLGLQQMLPLIQFFCFVVRVAAAAVACRQVCFGL